MEVDLARLKAERVANGFTQEEIAKKMGWRSTSSYAKRENGTILIGADELSKIVTILGYDQDSIGIFFRSSVPKRERIL